MIQLGEKDLTINEVIEILHGNEPIAISKVALNKVKESFKFLKDFSKGKVRTIPE